MAHPIESDSCPVCRSPDYITIHSDWSAIPEIVLVNRRRCADCDTKYSPPISNWVSGMAVLLGTASAAASVVLAIAIPDYVDSNEVIARIGIRSFFYAAAAVGVSFAIKGVLRLLFPPAHRDRPSPGDVKDDGPSEEDEADDEKTDRRI